MATKAELVQKIEKAKQSIKTYEQQLKKLEADEERESASKLIAAAKKSGVDLSKMDTASLSALFAQIKPVAGEQSHG